MINRGLIFGYATLLYEGFIGQSLPAIVFVVGMLAKRLWKDKKKWVSQRSYSS